MATKGWHRVLGLFAVAAAAACAHPWESYGPAMPLTLGHVQPTSPNDANELTFALLREMSASRSNVAVSGFAARAAVATAMASSPQHEQIERLLGYSRTDKPGHDELSNWYASGTFAHFAARPHVFYRKGADLAPGLLEQADQRFAADASEVDFSQEDSWKEIDRTAMKYSGGQVEHVARLAAGRPAPGALITTSFGINGEWTDPFGSDASRDESFTLESGHREDVRMMHGNLHAEYAEVDGLTLVELTFGQLVDDFYFGEKGAGFRFNQGMGMLFVLPPRGVTIAALESTLAPPSYQRWVAALHAEQVDVRLPWFEVRSSFDLAAPLERIDLRLSPASALFFGVGAAPPILLLHDAEIAVYEGGVRGAPIGRGMWSHGPGAASPAVARFDANRPFLFFIHDRRREDGSWPVLVAGHFRDPRKER